MTILLVLIPLSLLALAVAVAAFVWAVRNGQFEDLEGEGARILFDDEPGPRPVAPLASAEPPSGSAEAPSGSAEPPNASTELPSASAHAEREP